MRQEKLLFPQTAIMTTQPKAENAETSSHLHENKRLRNVMFYAVGGYLH